MGCPYASTVMYPPKEYVANPNPMLHKMKIVEAFTKYFVSFYSSIQNDDNNKIGVQILPQFQSMLQLLLEVLVVTP